MGYDETYSMRYTVAYSVIILTSEQHIQLVSTPSSIYWFYQCRRPIVETRLSCDRSKLVWSPYWNTPDSLLLCWGNLMISFYAQCIMSQWQYVVHPKNYAHEYEIVVLCWGLVPVDFIHILVGYSTGTKVFIDCCRTSEMTRTILSE